MAGGTHVFVDDALRLSDADDLASVVDVMKVTRVSLLVGVPSMLSLLADVWLRKRRQQQQWWSRSRRRRGMMEEEEEDVVNTILYGGGKMSADIRLKLHAAWSKNRSERNVHTRMMMMTNCAENKELRIVGAYGMTETASSNTFIDHTAVDHSCNNGSGMFDEQTKRFLHDSAGILAPHVEVQIRYDTNNNNVYIPDNLVMRNDDNHHYYSSSSLSTTNISEHHQHVARPRIGQIYVRGPHIFPGYMAVLTSSPSTTSQHYYYAHHHEEESNPSYAQQQGWFATGDLGWHDTHTGMLFICGRVHDVIKCGGENVFASEVETFLCALPPVCDAAVVGVKDDMFGNVVAAAIELKNDVSVLVPSNRKSYDEVDSVLSSIYQACEQRLASFKRPKWLVPVQTLPRSALGKVMKERVRETVDDFLRNQNLQQQQSTDNNNNNKSDSNNNKRRLAKL